ncbi:MAG: GNAT family N-acetyltransferase [Mollicutes bacterium]|nr:GNAT family N-acetyltransferase [Mollicutes bacterium]
MEKAITKKIETKNLILRKAKLNDAAELFLNVGRDNKVSKYTVWNKYDDVKVAENLIEKWVREYKDYNKFRWVVILKETNTLIGTITSVNCDKTNNTVEIGYAYGSLWWNKGYATEALRAVINYLFEETPVETIYAQFIPTNIGSGKVMEKVGMKHEGTLRNRLIDKNTNKYANLESYSIIREDYK